MTAYLEQLNTDNSKHENKENGDDNNVANTSQCNNYT